MQSVDSNVSWVNCLDIQLDNTGEGVIGDRVSKKRSGVVRESESVSSGTAEVSNTTEIGHIVNPVSIVKGRAGEDVVGVCDNVSRRRVWQRCPVLLWSVVCCCKTIS